MKLFNTSILLFALALGTEGASISRRATESQKVYDETTKDFTRLGLCRFYVGQQNGKGPGDYINTCTPYCKAEIEKAADKRFTNVGCQGGNYKWVVDPKGVEWQYGKCICNSQLVNIIADIVITEGLPMIAAMHCVTLFRVFQDVLKVGASVFPASAAASAAGKAAITAAKTIAKTANKKDKKSGTYREWYTGICGDNEYTAKSEEIYNNMLKAPDSAAKACDWPCPGTKAYEEQQKKKEADKKEAEKKEAEKKKPASSSSAVAPKPTTTQQAPAVDRYTQHMSALSAISKASAAASTSTAAKPAATSQLAPAVDRYTAHMQATKGNQ